MFVCNSLTIQRRKMTLNFTLFHLNKVLFQPSNQSFFKQSIPFILQGHENVCINGFNIYVVSVFFKGPQGICNFHFCCQLQLRVGKWKNYIKKEIIAAHSMWLFIKPTKKKQDYTEHTKSVHNYLPITQQGLSLFKMCF